MPAKRKKQTYKRSKVAYKPKRGDWVEIVWCDITQGATAGEGEVKPILFCTRGYYLGKRSSAARGPYYCFTDTVSESGEAFGITTMPCGVVRKIEKAQ